MIRKKNYWKKKIGCEKMVKEFKEKTITVNLRGAFAKAETHRANKALNIVKEAVKKETRLTDIRVSNKVNELVWSRGRKKSLRKVTIKVVKDKEIARVMMPEEKMVEKKDEKAKKKEEKVNETKKEEKTQKTAEVKKEEKVVAEKK